MIAEELYNECSKEAGNFPPGTRGLPPNYPVAGRGFFPVTSGSFHDGCLTTEIFGRKILFVGQDWGCEANLGALIKNRDADIASGTGRILLDLLNEAEIPLEACFFTNALFGVRTGRTNTGHSDGWKNAAFVQKVRECDAAANRCDSTQSDRLSRT